MKATIGRAGRVVALAPDFRTTDVFVDSSVPADVKTLTADSVEDGLDAFTDNDNAVLTLSNRYDGIDLPDDDCRLVILNGLPAKGDLQERFLYSALGAQNVLQERIRARIAQGVGRATRNFRDFATVIVLGDELISYLTRDDVQSVLHPDLHAEIEFGWRQSLDATSANMTENIGIFNDQGPEWADVEQDILTQRDHYERVTPAGADQLQAAAQAEVEAYESIWSGDWPAALDVTRAVIDRLSGGRFAGRYAALWNYLAASIAIRLHRSTGDAQYASTAATYLRAARGCARGTKWLDYLASQGDTSTDFHGQSELDPLDQLAVQNILARLADLGRPTVFDNAVAHIAKALSETPATPYEQALSDLGLFAGASESAQRSNASAAPDGAWLFGDITWISWEAKSNAKPDGQLGADAAREAGGHLRYIARTRNQQPPEDSFGFIIAPQERTHPASVLVAEDHLWLIRPEDVLDLHNKITRAWRRLRGLNAPTPGTAATILRADHALPSQWIADLRTTRLADQREIDTPPSSSSRAR